jgi:CubicO group peptidase (beta-lactamase class C family)
MIHALLLSAILPTAPVDFEKAWTYADQLPTQAMVVMIDGKIVFERYARGGSEAQTQPLASGSKSFTGTLAAALITDGVFKGFDDKVSDTLPDWKQDPQKAKITLRQLLSLTSGLAVGGHGRGAGQRAGWEDAAKGEIVTEPGSQFQYGPNAFNTFGLMVEKKVGAEWTPYLHRRLLDPLGIKVEYGNTTADGKPQLAGGARMSARDWLTFGEFIRLDGKWKGKQLIDPKVLGELFVGSKANPAYGISWWLGDEDEMQMMRAAGVKPRDQGFKMAAGAGKQRLYVIPSEKMVVVRLGRVAGGRGWNDREFLKLLVD